MKKGKEEDGAAGGRRAEVGKEGAVTLSGMLLPTFELISTRGRHNVILIGFDCRRSVLLTRLLVGEAGWSMCRRLTARRKQKLGVGPGFRASRTLGVTFKPLAPIYWCTRFTHLPAPWKYGGANTTPPFNYTVSLGPASLLSMLT